jgi:hypothetical protein
VEIDTGLHERRPAIKFMEQHTEFGDEEAPYVAHMIQRWRENVLHKPTIQLTEIFLLTGLMPWRDHRDHLPSSVVKNMEVHYKLFREKK